MIKEMVSVILTAVGLAAVGFLGAPGCAKDDANALRVGVTSGPHAQIMELVATEARQRGLAIKVVEFSDYVQPNAALADGSLDVNSFQHLPYLEQQKRDRGYRLDVVGTTVNFPIAAYSQRVTSLDALPRGAQIAIPNDPTNGARALRLLEQGGLVRLRVPKGREQVTRLDVEGTRGGYQIVELDAAQLTRSLDDVDLAVINTNCALEAGLDPFKGLLREPADSPYANVLVVRAGDADRADVRKLVEIYHSPRVRQFIDETFKGAIVPAW